MAKQTKIGAAPARIVALGGGTGLSTVLRGLKQYVSPAVLTGAVPANDGYPISDLAAIVTVTDDGGSSGRLRREYRVLPPGDIRNCMVALSQDEALLGQLFQYRFKTGRGLRGHSFGNLFLTALSHVTGDFARAVRVSSEVLAIRGRIFPSTEQFVTLEAVLENGKTISGESRIGRTRQAVRQIRLVPRRVKPLPEAIEAIKAADLILLGPGSLYTSVIPNLLVAEIGEAIENSRATCVYIANLMTQPGETRGLSLADHVRAIHENTGRKLVEWVVVNSEPITSKMARRYEVEGAEPVAADLDEIEKMGLRCVCADMVEVSGVIRHNAGKLAQLLLQQFVEKAPTV